MKWMMIMFSMVMCYYATVFVKLVSAIQVLPQ